MGSKPVSPLWKTRNQSQVSLVIPHHFASVNDQLLSLYDLGENSAPGQRYTEKFSHMIRRSDAQLQLDDGS